MTIVYEKTHSRVARAPPNEQEMFRLEKRYNTKNNPRLGTQLILVCFMPKAEWFCNISLAKNSEEKTP
jgi:hypothetical protein